MKNKIHLMAAAILMFAMAATAQKSNNGKIFDEHPGIELMHKFTKAYVAGDKATLDAILISDYAKGTLPETFIQRIINLANTEDKIVIIDPKGDNYTKYKGAFTLTPNFKEFSTVIKKSLSSEKDIADEAIKLVIWSLRNNLGGEIFVPKIPSYKILDLARSINDKFRYKIIGTRPGEKIHEELISKADSLHTYDLKFCYSIVDKVHTNTIKNYKKKKIKKVKEGYEYNSLNNKKFLSINELKKLISKYKINLENKNV